MYENIGRLLAHNGARLVYTTNRVVGRGLKALESDYPSFHSGVSVNEKIAFELALTGSYASKRTACIFSTEGLYEALDPLMSSAYTGVLGGFLVLTIRETEEEVTPLGPFSKLPLIVVERGEDLAHDIAYGYSLSEKYEIPVIIQTTPEAGGEAGTRGQGPGVRDQGSGERSLDSTFDIRASKFVKDPGRWAATPKFRYQLHKELNEKIEKIRDEFEAFEGNRVTRKGSTGIITTGRSRSDFYDDDVSILSISTVFPLPFKLVNGFIGEMDQVFIAEGPYPAIELQIGDRRKVIIEPSAGAQRRQKPAETMYGFSVVRDTLGPASSLNMAHAIKVCDPDRKILAITYEDYFFHSGMPAFVNTLYNGSSYVLLIMVNRKEEELKEVMKGFGFRNFFHLNAVSEVEHFRESNTLTALFCKGII